MELDELVTDGAGVVTVTDMKGTNSDVSTGFSAQVTSGIALTAGTRETH